MFKLYVASVNLPIWAGQSRDKQTIVKYIEKGPRQKWDNANKKRGCGGTTRVYEIVFHIIHGKERETDH